MAEFVVLANPGSGMPYNFASASLLTGQAALTTAPSALPANAVSGVLLQADPANTVNILVGNASNQYLVLAPGAYLALPVTNTSLIYAKTATGTGNLNWLARS